MLYALRVVLMLCLCLAAPAGALTVGFSGTVLTVGGTATVLDGSVAPGGGVTGTYDVDPTSASSSSPFVVGLGQLVFQLGSYLFSSTADPHEIALIDDRVVATDPFLVLVDVWQSGAILLSDLDPVTNPSPSAGYVAQVEFFDFSASTFDGSEAAPFVPNDTIGWSQVRLTLNSVDGLGAFDGRVTVDVAIDSWNMQQVPEPHSAALLLLGLAALALRARAIRLG